jgi:hypothetical protein
VGERPAAVPGHGIRVVTGVDSRIFGYQGFYTHFDIAPKVQNSFGEYLARKGYQTAAFYPVEGSFYNAEKAFRSYGFREFIDGQALRLPSDWGSLIDRDIIKAVVEHGAFKRSGPFFYFVGTSQNHGPHPCRSFESEQQFLTTFAANVSFEQNCELNEYLKRAASTSEAFEPYSPKAGDLTGDRSSYWFMAIINRGLSLRVSIPWPEGPPRGRGSRISPMSEPVPMAIRHSFTCWRQTGRLSGLDSQSRPRHRFFPPS